MLPISEIRITDRPIGKSRINVHLTPHIYLILLICQNAPVSVCGARIRKYHTQEYIHLLVRDGPSRGACICETRLLTISAFKTSDGGNSSWSSLRDVFLNFDQWEAVPEHCSGRSCHIGFLPHPKRYKGGQPREAEFTDPGWLTPVFAAMELENIVANTVYLKAREGKLLSVQKPTPSVQCLHPWAWLVMIFAPKSCCGIAGFHLSPFGLMPN